MWTIQLPLRIACDDQSKPVKHRPGWEQPYFAINLNQYRNAQHFTLNNAKVNFEIYARKLIRAAGIPKLKRVTLEYVLYPGTAQLCDTGNICSIADKFFSDSLKASKIIEDDNYKFVTDLRFRFGGIDRENPRVDVIVRNADDQISTVPLEPSTERETQPMKVTTRSTHIINLTKEDLTNAVRDFLIAHDVPVPPGMDFDHITQLTDGTFELRVEVGVDADVAKKPGRKPKTDPKTAMQQVNAAQAQQAAAPAAQPEKPAEEQPQPSKTALSLKEQAAKEAEELERQEAAQRAAAKKERQDKQEVEELQQSEEETTTSEPAPELDLSPKTDAEKHLDAVKGTPEEAEARAAVEKERAIKANPVQAMQTAKNLTELEIAYGFSDKGESATNTYQTCKEALTAEANKPKKPSLFGGLTRPKN